MGSSASERAVSEVEFHLQNAAYPFVAASDAADCRVELATMVKRPDSRYAQFVNVVDADPARIETVASTCETIDVTLLREYETGGLFEFLVSGDCPPHRLAQLGALPRTVEGVDGTGRIVAEIPSSYDDAAIVETFLHDTPEAELVTKRTKSAVDPLVSGSAFRQVLQTCLTDRQRDVLQIAYEAGYYDWPRECTGKEVANSLDISSATFSEHVHAAERNLLTVLFDGSIGERSQNGAE